MEINSQYVSSKGHPRWENLASEELGSKVVYATDEFFGGKENLIKGTQPISRPGTLTENGRWVDGWVTRRRRDQGHDFAIIKLGRSGIIKEIMIDTKHITGSLPSFISLEGHGKKDLYLEENFWEELLPVKRVHPNCTNLFRVEGKEIFTHIRLNIFPDGGIARIRLFGRSVGKDD